jgi:hypothetical protein
MRTKMMSSLRKAIADQSGQSIVLLGGAMFALCAMAGLTLDIGHAYSVRTQLQDSVNAAGLAAAGYIFYSEEDNAIDQAKIFANLNPLIGGLDNHPDANLMCVSALMPKGTTCGASSSPNAVWVTEYADVPTTFLRIFGRNYMHVQARAQATWGTAQPYNVALIVDATPSMGNTDPYCPGSGGVTAEECAMNGVQTMLSEINPCINGQTSCPSATSKNSIFRIALFSFPNISAADVSKDYCASGNPTFQLYTFPTPGATDGYNAPNGYLTYKTKSGVSTNITYLITGHNADTANIDTYGFTSDWYSASATNNLKASSILVKAVGNGTTKTCIKQPSGYTMPTGWNDSKSANYQQGLTYQAGVIYAAQAALDAEQKQTTGLGIKATNVIIFVSDGQANAPAMEFRATTDAVTSGSGTAVQTKTGLYPDSTQDCQQTIAAAQFAASKGTRVYGVAYGTEAGGCAMDNKVIAVAPLNTTVSNPIKPCEVMKNMSSTHSNDSSQLYFYAEGQSNANGCTPTGTTTTNMTNIFQAIAASMTLPRLIPNNAT